MTTMSTSSGIDQTAHEIIKSFNPLKPKVLYHYTTWDSALKILRSQRFWQTDHNCLNDEHELRSADDVIVEVARSMRVSANAMAGKLLEQFVNYYPKLKPSQRVTAYVTSFSAARDDGGQFERYGNKGDGVCLGLRLLDDLGMERPDMSTFLLKVDYSEESWEQKCREHFVKLCSAFSAVKSTTTLYERGLLALYEIVAVLSIQAKHARWARENEYRIVTLVRPSANIMSVQLSDGKRCLTNVALRPDGKLLPFAEIIIGKHGSPERCGLLVKKLHDRGYRPDSVEYPNITISPT